MNSLRLSRLIPAILLASTLVSCLLLFWHELGAARERIEEQGMDEVNTTLTHLQNLLNTQLADEDLEEARLSVSVAALRPDIRTILLVDDRRRVLLASRYLWEGQAVDHPGFDHAMGDEVRAMQANRIAFSDDRRMLHGYYPVTLKIGRFGIGSEHIGVLYVEYDLDRRLSSATRDAMASAAVIGALLLSVTLAVALLLYLLVTRRVQRLVAISSRYMAGEREARVDIDGEDEMAHLGATFDALADGFNVREDELRRKQRELQGLIENAPSVIFMKDAQGRYLMINTRFEELMGVKNEAIRGMSDYDIFPVEVAEKLRGNDQMVFEQRRAVQSEERIQVGDEERHYITNKFPICDDEGEVIAICGISHDITEHQRMQSSLALAKAVIDNANEAVVITDLGGMIEDINAAFTRVTGFNRREAIGCSTNIQRSGRHDKAFYREMWRKIREDGYWEGEIWDRRKNGEIYPKWLSINTIRDDDGEPRNYVGIFSDISDRKAAEQKLESLAYYDPLTQLPNRSLFMDRLRQSIAACERERHGMAVMFLDLDRFKYVNDTLGHNAGDTLLVKVAARLREVVRESDTVARLGGDEFTVTLNRIGHSDEAALVAGKIVEALRRPFKLGDDEVEIGVSIGISTFPADGGNCETLLKHADMALYKAKDSGRNQYQYFSHELQEAVYRQLQLEGDLRRAIEKDELELYYQPKVELASGRVTGMEALVRWNHPQKGMVPPDQFIPCAEENGLIIPMGEWIIEEACRQAALWKERFGRPLKVAINLSSAQFHSQGLAEMIVEAVKRHQLEPGMVELEITESSVIGDVEEAVAIMDALSARGLKLAIDDFGTGYSSLSYLKRFPIDTLKIDQSFVRDLTIDSDDAAIVQAIIAMAESLQLEVVAEGVETEEQLAFLERHGCGHIQGYHISRPLPAAEFASFIEAQAEVGAA